MRKVVRPPTFLSLRVALPQLSEQQTIATFLDRETAKIDALVAEQENLIALLKEKRQAVISHAVTKGLDPTVPMKDSGIEWLGEVPAHWIVQPLKFSALFRSGGTPDKGRLDYWNGQIPWASAKDLKVENLYDTADHITDQTIIDGVISLLPTETVVVVVRGMILARLLPVVTIKVPMAINQDLKALIPKEHVSSTFLPWLLRASEVESLTRLDEAGHGTKALRMDAWGAMKVSLPPKQEQKGIAAFLDLETTKLDDLTTEAQHTINRKRPMKSVLTLAV